ncbi:hypothetical protein B0A48_03417 [Cryoendolithus antarcticus]|uniref:Uncharacterized protein n=1 Tax=Cryoendolithus antarcticus TaxID=1507870 RepID=A0A1V8TJY4_9PEZI|nr:hypothetical protein B0A48_03417 [Cryoendolithus antarcticus]
MFSSMLLGNGFKATDPYEEREPPAAATQITFPQVKTPAPVGWDTRSTGPPLQPLFSRLVRLTDVTDQHLEALNIDISSNVPTDHFVPAAKDGSSYWPKLSSKATAPLSYAGAASADASMSKKRKDFDDKIAELKYDSEDVYAALTKTTRDGQKAPRVASMRKFWQGLESMSGYWDDSLDQYFESTAATEHDDGGPKTTKRARVSEPCNANGNGNQNIYSLVQDEAAIMSLLSGETPKSSAILSHGTSLPLGRLTPHHGNHHNDKEISISPPLPSRSSMRYKGHRIGTGRDMPESYRQDTVRAFMKALVWPFQASVAIARRVPVVQIDKLNLPVRLSGVVSRVPADRAKARAGIIQGPIMGVQVRNDTGFLDANGKPMVGKSRLDQLREIGGLLALAQDRRRQGTADNKPGEGEWWTTKPRWGGGPGGAAEDAQGLDGNGEMLTVEEAVNAAKNDPRSQNRRRSTPVMLWKELKCGSGMRDQRTEYMAIGKELNSPYDEVFMVSSLNHHISILKLTIHDAYLDYLAGVGFPSVPLMESDWSTPRLQRSKWFNLFDADDRVEAFSALWAIMSYLTRDPVPDGNADTGAEMS